jgi:L-serine dehydratase
MIETGNLIGPYPDFFNDVFGPIMQPGSSSHTAAPCRLGYMAHSLLGQGPRKIRILLDKGGSFAGTFGIMAEDSGMLTGAMGLLPDDERLFQVRGLARQAGIDVSFEFTDLTESKHVNAMKFVLAGADGQEVSLAGNSTGGGMIETCSVDGFPFRSQGDTYVLLVFDALKSEQAHKIIERLAALVESGTSERPDGKSMSFFKVAEPPDIRSIREIVPGTRVALLRPVLPVLTRPERKAQLFDTMVGWREFAQQQGLPLWEVAVKYQMDASGWTREQVLEAMRRIERVMYRQTHAVYQEPGRVPVTPFKPDMASEWGMHMESAGRLTDNLVANTLKWAYGAGAGIPGVPVVAGPMGGGGGYVHAALWAVKEAHGFGDEDLLRGLFVAAGVGVIAFSRTEPTGEVIGCTGECGVCGAMAAAGIAEMAGGTPEQVENAASLHLQAFIGMPCDPIAGGLGQPCRSRIIAAICMASTFADLALAGREGVLPLHEVIDVADEVGRGLPAALLCTARGGASVAPAGRERSKAFQEWFEEARESASSLPPGNLI